MVGKYSNKIDFVHTKGNGLAMDETAFKNTIRHFSISVCSQKFQNVIQKKSATLCNQIPLSSVSVCVKSSCSGSKINAITTSISQDFKTSTFDKKSNNRKVSITIDWIKEPQ